MTNPLGCPREQVLVQYAAGQLDSQSRRRVDEHVTRCVDCAGALEWLRWHRVPEADVASEEGSSIRPPPPPPDLEPESDSTDQLDEASFDFGLFDPPSQTHTLGRLCKYEILSVVGQGGMGVVFKARDSELQHLVAIKALKRQFACNALARRRFLRESRAAAAISHVNVVKIHGVLEHRNVPFLIMELVSGCSLRKRIRRERRLPVLDVIRLSCQIAAGLAAAHAQGVIHRDIKPANVMLQACEEGGERVKITDFGLARIAVDNVELTSHEMALGTPAYMAPEQIRGEPIDARTDLFGLGCVMYAMLNGFSPFHGRHPLDATYKVIEYAPPPLHEVDRGVPVYLSEIVSRLLNKEPADRYQSAAEVMEILNHHLAVLHQLPPARTSKGRLHAPRARPGGKRRRPYWPALLPFFLVVLAGAIILIGLLWSSVSSSFPPGLLTPENTEFSRTN